MLTKIGSLRKKKLIEFSLIWQFLTVYEYCRFLIFKETFLHFDKEFSNPSLLQYKYVTICSKNIPNRTSCNENILYRPFYRQIYSTPPGAHSHLVHSIKI